MSRDILMAKFEEKSSSVSCVSEIDAFKKMYLGKTNMNIIITDVQWSHAFQHAIYRTSVLLIVSRK